MQAKKENHAAQKILTTKRKIKKGEGAQITAGGIREHLFLGNQTSVRMVSKACFLGDS